MNQESKATPPNEGGGAVDAAMSRLPLTSALGDGDYVSQALAVGLTTLGCLLFSLWDKLLLVCLGTL